jgi:hypothetical protein
MERVENAEWRKGVAREERIESEGRNRERRVKNREGKKGWDRRKGKIRGK